jgi:DNA-binding transcriptional ArsR family regulator
VRGGWSPGAWAQRGLDACLVSVNLPSVQTYQSPQLDALGDSTRRAIVERLLRGPLPVGRLAQGLPVTRPAVSQHLRVLENARLVTFRAAGTRRIYALDPTGFDSLRDYLDRFWDGALAAFKAEVESSHPPETEHDHHSSAGQRSTRRRKRRTRP